MQQCRSATAASRTDLGNQPIGAMLDPRDLDHPGRLLQHVLLATDGTVVPLLERCFHEPIRLAGHVQSVRPASPTDPAELELVEDEPVLHRQVLLQGDRTGYNYVYADSLIVLGRLPLAVREALLHTSTPIGRALTSQRVETLREILHTGIHPDTHMPFRVYRIVVGGRPVILITENFPQFAMPEHPTTTRTRPPTPDRPQPPGTRQG